MASDELLPVIYLTAKDSEADQVRGIGLGADDYISKACGDAMLYMHISNLRKKLGSASSMIVNKRRVGYGIEE